MKTQTTMTVPAAAGVDSTRTRTDPACRRHAFAVYQPWTATDPTLSNTRTIDGFGPLPVSRPSSVAELSELVRQAAADGKAIYPVGGGTMLDYGLRPAKPGTAVELGGLDRDIDYPARDVTTPADAGITDRQLEGYLRSAGQPLPVDPRF